MQMPARTDLANVDVHHARESPLEAAGPPTASGPGLAGPLLPPIAPTSKPASLKEGQMGAAMSPKSSRGLPDIGSPLSTSAGSTKPLTSTSGQILAQAVPLGAVYGVYLICHQGRLPKMLTKRQEA